MDRELDVGRPTTIDGHHGLRLRISRMPCVIVAAVAQVYPADERDILGGPADVASTTNF